jgi:putative CocE/NonD family hydrolase
MIPMRDGVKLNTEIYVPEDLKEPLPFILVRTPYGIAGSGARIHGDYLKDMGNDGYIFVFQDIRGRFKSEGQFVMIRAPRDKGDPKAIDESTDTTDTINYLLTNVENNNGRVGMLGISYPGWLTVMALIDPHPALKAASPQASPADMFLGDDFHHNGAFRLSYGFEYVAAMESSKTFSVFQFDKADTFEWYLNLGPLSNANEKYFHGERPTWNDFVEHPNYDVFWQKQACAPYLNKVTVPTLNVAGWWDQEDFYGPLTIYKQLEKHDRDHKNFLAVGPWNHGGWANGDGERLGKIRFDAPTGQYYRRNIQAPWFAYHLKDKGKLDFAEAQTFRTGSNEWKTYDSWPPKEARERKLYFRENGMLSFEPPTDKNTPTDTNARRGFPEPAETADRRSPSSATGYDSYISDPANPIPCRPRPVSSTYPGPDWPVWLVQDQRFVHLRPDVASWETEPLDEDIVVTGDIVAHLFASSSGTDCDWIVKLIDVYPENAPGDKMGGFQLMVANEVFRARFRKSFEKPEPLVPNEVNEYAIDIHDNDHCFLKGHKIMVQVQSTWFPVIDRNPQTYVPNIFKAKASDYKAAEQRVWRSSNYPSHIILPVVASRRVEREE